MYVIMVPLNPLDQRHCPGPGDFMGNGPKGVPWSISLDGSIASRSACRGMSRAGGTRTHTGFRPEDFKSSMSTGFITAPGHNDINMLQSIRQSLFG